MMTVLIQDVVAQERVGYEAGCLRESVPFRLREAVWGRIGWVWGLEELEAVTYQRVAKVEEVAMDSNSFHRWRH